VRDLNTESGQLVQVLDRLLHPFAALAEVKARLRGLFDLA